MANESQRTSVLIILLVAGLVMFCAYYFLDLSNQFVFWSSLILSSASLAMIMASSGNERTRMISLLVFAGMLHIAPVIRGGGAGIAALAIFGRDETYQVQLDNIVYDTGVWRTDTGLGPARTYSLYPIMPILASVMYNILGVRGAETCYMIIAFPVITAVVPLVLYIQSMRLFTKNAEWALWSGYIFALNEQFLFFEASFSYESLGIVFFTTALYLIARRRLSTKINVLIVLMILSLTLTHFWSDLNLTLFLVVLSIFPSVLGALARRYSSSPDMGVYRPSLPTVMVAVVLFLTYASFVTASVVGRYGGTLLSSLVIFLEQWQRLSPGTSFRSSAEILLIVLGQLVLVGFGALGFLARRGPSLYKKLLFLLGGIYLIIILFGLPAGLARPILHRGFFFAFFVIAPVVAWTIHVSSKITVRQVKALLLILTVVSIVLIQEPWFRYPDFVAPASQVYSARWTGDHVAFGSPFVSIRSISDSFGGYGRMDDLGLYEPFYSNQSLIGAAISDGGVCRLLEPYGGHYLALSSSTNDWLVRYYIQQYAGEYGSGEMIVSHIMYTWATTTGANRVMSSGEVSLYYLAC